MPEVCGTKFHVELAKFNVTYGWSCL